MAIASGLRRRAARFRSDGSGQVAFLFGLMVIPLLCAVGAGLDYGRQRAAKVRLDAALDLAVLALASRKVNVYDQTMANAAQTQFRNAAGNINGVSVTDVDIPVPKAVDGNISVSGSYKATIATTLTKLMKFDTMAMSGEATASRSVPLYTDFYLVLDTSGSMGLPTTQDGQDRLSAINPDNKKEYPTGCTFACHFPGSKGYDLSRTAKPRIDLRADSVGLAAQNLFQTAKTSQKLTNQFRFGLYPFIVKVAPAYPKSSNGGVANPPVTTNLDAAAAEANRLAEYLDDGETNGPWGSGGTHFTNVLPTMNTIIPTSGDGLTSSKPRAFLFLVTDGVNNSQTYPFNGSNPALMDASRCTPIKSRGITLSILYTPYIEIKPANHSFAGDEDGKVNALIPNIPDRLKSCASAGYFFTANTPQDINDAMQAMFKQAVAETRLTQ